MAEVLLSLGSNQGDRLKALADATQLVNSHIGMVQLNSYVVESEPWGFNSDTPFYNLVLIVQTALLPVLVLEKIVEIETKMGRIRSGRTYLNRIIDIDILFYNNEIIATEILEIPHPHMHNRRFVLDPLASIAGGFIHPVLNTTVNELLEKLVDEGKVAVVIDAERFARLI